ncbi:MAG: hypothetical protein HY691_13675, partial [Chloroflexi bacterium]|nr:hypothetical protein [Chloroflexota bacterium]
IPTGTREMQALLVLDRVGQNWRRHFRGSCRFVPLVGAAGWPEGDQPPPEPFPAPPHGCGWNGRKPTA